MAPDTQYNPIPYVYQSRGAIARSIQDQAPEFTYLQLLNCQEREEQSMSSRYGTVIVNRDPAGIGVNNYYFSSPVTSLSRLVYLTNAWRYAGLEDGTLWRRAGNTQGAYTQIYTGLSGQTFSSIVTSCYESSQAYLFMFDAAASIKDSGTGNPSLVGIDPPNYTANSIPYAPLLTLIDNFGASNAYTVSGVSGWAYSNVTTIPTAAGQSAGTDFPEFVNAAGTNYSLAGGVQSVTLSAPGTLSDPLVYAGFPSISVSPGESVTLAVGVAGYMSLNTGSVGTGSLNLEYSINGGVTWTSFYSASSSISGDYGSGTPTIAVVGLTNLDQLQIRNTASLTLVSGTGTNLDRSVINLIQTTVNSPGVFGKVCNGILSIIGSQAPTAVPIVSIASTGFLNGLYTQLLITTSVPHGIVTGTNVSVYGTSNDLADGFYSATTLSSTTLIVPYVSPVAIGATGGTIYFTGSGIPETCVLANEYSNPYPTQFSAWGFYSSVPTATTSFPVGQWSGSVAPGATGSIGKTVGLDLSINNQVTDDDLIVLTLNVGSPENITNIRLQFDVNSSGYGSTYYYKDIAPSYYQGNVANQVQAYQATQNQILADTLGLITGAPPSSTTAQLQPANFSTGGGAWTAIYLRRGDFLPVGNAGESGLDWSNVTGWQIMVTMGSTGSSTIAVNGLYLQWGYGPSSFGGIGYDYRYTYYNANTGTESNGSPEQNYSTLFGYLSSLTAPIYLRQAVQLTGIYSTDSQVTHLRIYRRGGIYAGNWYMIDQVPNITSGGTFYYKDVIPDASLAQSNTLILSNDPPVTSSLQNPIATTLSAATTGPGNTIYSTYSPQTIKVANATANFVVGQIVVIGNANNLEQVRVINGGAGQFTAIVMLQHNAGEPVQAFSVPRQPCDLAAVSSQGGVTQVWLAGDPNNPHYLYYSNPGYPESFGPQNYIAVSSPDDPINAVINWRGTIVVGTLKSWYIIVGGARPYAQPTGSQHGIVGKNAWTIVEGSIWYRAADGLREFTGADGYYKTLPIEWVYRNNPLSLIPLADLTQQSQDILCFYQNCIYASYISQTNNGQRYRIVYDHIYERFRYDDIQATAMLWEKDTNTFLVGRQIGVGQYAVVQDQVYTQDYDDGGWNAGILVQTPLTLTIQHPYRDLGKPHYEKQWNRLETDVNTQGQNMTTQLLFDDGGTITPLTLATANTGTQRKKVQLLVNNGEGQQAYRMSILHTMQVTKAPILYQDDVYAALLANYDAAYDTYWIKFGTDLSKIVKQGYFDYTSAVAINVSLYADNNTTAYYTFQLPAQTERYVQRERFGNVAPGTTAFTLRTWRLVMTTTDTAQPFQLWVAPRIEWKTIEAGHSYQIKELEV